MAEKKVIYTHEQDLGPGVVRTPGYPVDDTAALNGIADRRIDHLGKVADHPILSTYSGPQNGVTESVPKPRLEVTEVPNAGSPPSTVATPKA